MECLSQVGGTAQGCRCACCGPLVMRSPTHPSIGTPTYLCLLQESVSFEDIMSQMQDMINPQASTLQVALCEIKFADKTESQNPRCGHSSRT